MEQNYTIPINEAFEASRDNPACGCPLCALYRKLEENELERILGAAMMEPDVRIRTNKEGFCRLHYDMMFVRRNRLGMALTMQSHLDELADELKNGGFLRADDGAKPQKRIAHLEESCYICNRVGHHFSLMVQNIIYLWNHDPDFPPKLQAQPYFCLPHYRLLLSFGRAGIPKKKVPEFASACARVVETYLDTLREDIDWFCKKFDYRYDAEPWYNSKDAVERAIRFLRSDLHPQN